jgi:predicted Rossmann fold flavoprotein
MWPGAAAGGGPAGFFAAIRCAELNPNLRVLILEKAQTTLGKILISGGGRCNVAHACFDPAELVKFYPRGANELRGAFARFQPADTVKWFESRGVKLKTEADGRMFPVTDKSEDIANCLREAAKRAGVNTQTGASLLKAEKSPMGGFRLGIVQGGREETLEAKKVLIATGSNPQVWEFLKTLGHSIEKPAPSLFTFKVKDERLDGLEGVSLDDVTLKMEGLTQRGALLVTHWGLSGPATLKLSAWGARILFEKNYRASLTVNWLGGYRLDSALEVLRRSKDWRENARKKVAAQSAFSQVPLRLWKRLTQFIGGKNWGDISKAELLKLAEELTAGQFEIIGKGPFKEEFVSCGGVKLSEVDFKTMQSRLVAGLFFAGEVLDVDGVTGGFNFQAAWTTGWLAGNALSG